MNLIDESMHSRRPWKKLWGYFVRAKLEANKAVQLVQSGNAVRRGATDTLILEL